MTDEPPAARIILLNGASSSGKTTLARAIQRALDQPFLHLASDYLTPGLPERREREGPFRWWDNLRPRYFDGFQRSIAAFAAAGNDLIVDHIIEFVAWRADLARLLRPYDVFLVGVHCALEEIDRREQRRGDRKVGEGRSHIEDDRIHTFGPYDCEVDTSGRDPTEVAGEVLAAWRQRSPSVLFRSEGVRLRAAVEDDSEGVSRVHFEAIRGTAAASYPPEVIEGWARPPDDARREEVRRAFVSGDELFVVAEEAGAIVGFGSIVPSLHELRAVYVDPRAGRRGIGSRILAELERLARGRGLPELHMDASLNAEAFYRRHGYQVVERGVHRQSSGVEMACVRMRKSLGSDQAGKPP